MIDIKTAAARAAAWLEANPDKHIARNLAIDERNRKVIPTDPTADCFCALGRLALELNLPLRWSGDYGAFADASIDYGAIFEANDAGSPLAYDTGTRRITPAHPEDGIAALRKLAR